MADFPHLCHPEALRMIRKWERRDLPAHFLLRLERWDNFRRGNGVFFRPMPLYTPASQLPVFDAEGVTPELAMFVLETHGVYVPTRNAERFIDYLQGKAIEGLSRKMWKEDFMTGAFWAEELVIAGLIGFHEAEKLFLRKLDGTLLWLFAAAEPDGMDAMEAADV